MLNDETGEKILLNLLLMINLFNKKKFSYFLGLQMDNQLKWEGHILQVCSKVVIAIGFIKYARKFLSREISQF